MVTGSVQYLDVGLTLEVQPIIYQDSDVAIKLNLEVSSLAEADHDFIGDDRVSDRHAQCEHAAAPEGRRDPDPRRPDIQDSDTRNATKIPGLG